MDNNRTMVQDDELEIDLREIFFLLLSKVWILVIVMVLGAALAGGFTKFVMSPVYSSTSQIYILSKSTSITSLTDLQLGTQLTQDYKEFITSRTVVDTVIDELNLDLTYEQFVGSVTVNNPANTRILYITVKSNDAYMAKRIVDKLTDVSAKRMAEIMETDEPNVMDYGHIPEHKSGPSTTKNAALGGMIAFAVTAAIIIALYLLNDSIRTSEDVEKYLGLEVLGSIPLNGNVSKKETRGKDATHRKMKKGKKK